MVKSTLAFLRWIGCRNKNIYSFSHLVLIRPILFLNLPANALFLQTNSELIDIYYTVEEVEH